MIPQLELIVLPLRLRITYDVISRLGDYFVYDRDQTTKQYEKLKTKFLPKTEVLHIEERASHKLSNSKPHALGSAVLKSALQNTEIASALRESNPVLASALDTYRNRLDNPNGPKPASSPSSDPTGTGEGSENSVSRENTASRRNARGRTESLSLNMLTSNSVTSAAVNVVLTLITRINHI